jgi:4-hydroxy-tetrahydrodipicolinate reductase
MRIAVAGATGKLGAPICAAIEAADDLSLAARIAPSLAGGGYACFGDVPSALAQGGIDALVDATTATAVVANAQAAIAAGVPVVIGTTGFDAADRDALDAAARAAGLPAFYAPNFAIGAVLMMRFAVEAARHLPDCEIVEEHAATKKDRPSGTAARTAELVAGTGAPPPPIHSVRLPGIVANQSVVFGGLGQTLTIRHDTTSRDAFAPGVLLALRRLSELPRGLTVGLDALLG